MRFRLTFLLIALSQCAGLLGQAPSLPPGLDDAPPKEEPSLPPGLAELDTQVEPQVDTNEPAQRRTSKLRIRTTLEARSGTLLQSNPYSDDEALSELRLQTQFSGSSKAASYRVTLDWIADFLADTSAIDLRNGQGWIDPREAWLSAQPLDFIDLKIGRQIATWGTGDLLFISDLFPKDWQALLLGREEDYLKAPSDAIKTSLFSKAVNLDLVYTPEFDPDRFVTGERISYFDTQSDTFAGRNRIVRPDHPSGGELSARAHRLFGAAEAAVYLHKGYWKQPAGSDPVSSQANFPRMEAVSASWRQPFAGGIANIEAGHYRSLDDTDGSNPRIRNSESRFLLGFERELATDLTGSMQFYFERIADYSNLRAALPASATPPKRTRQVLTTRITKRMLMQNLQLSIFAFYSPTDRDGYLRPHVSYSINDQWKASAGVNLFFGDRPDTFFGQFEDSSNAYLSLIRSFD